MKSAQILSVQVSVRSQHWRRVENRNGAGMDGEMATGITSGSGARLVIPLVSGAAVYQTETTE